MTTHVVYIARAIDKTLPIIIISDQEAIRQTPHNPPWLSNLYHLSYPVSDNDLQRFIKSLDESKLNRHLPIVVAESKAGQKCLRQVQRMGGASDPLLIQGEAGVGKRLLARAVHHYSVSGNRPLTPIAARDICGAWVQKLHRRIDRMPRSANPPVCLLIENIEHLNNQMQSQLLLIMDDMVAKGNGSGIPVRFIFTAEADLSLLCQNGLFRNDLYYRLTVLKVNVPPLRDRREDVPVLADYFAARYGMIHQGSLARLPEKIQGAFLDYHWPGNVAQLEGVIKMAMTAGPDLWMDELFHWCRDHKRPSAAPLPTAVIDLDICLRKMMDEKQDMSLKTARQHCVMQVEKKYCERP
jgi:DNA-binding NtrC family response regulator